MIHLLNGRAGKHSRTLGEGQTWCGKKLLGPPDNPGEHVQRWDSYGEIREATLDPELGDCKRCCEAFDAAYAAAFPEGVKPIATFRLDDPASVERAKSVLGPDALTKFFGPDGDGMSAFVRAVQEAGSD